MKTIFSILLIILLTNICSAQNLDTLMNRNPIFSKALQLSGLVVYKDTFYTPEERCHAILVMGHNGAVYREIPLDLTSLGIDANKAELEGIAIFKHYLLLTDESETNHRLYSYDLQNGRLDTINTRQVLIYDTGFTGMEGITVNEHDSICYVLKERNMDFQSEIRQFHISEMNGKIVLNFVSNAIIQHPQKHPDPLKNIRYADLFYSSRKHALLLLKSYYEGPMSKNNYYGVDTLCVNSKGFINREMISNIANEKCFINLTSGIGR